jgi:hypothetical protein
MEREHKYVGTLFNIMFMRATFIVGFTKETAHVVKRSFVAGCTKPQRACSIGERNPCIANIA